MVEQARQCEMSVYDRRAADSVRCTNPATHYAGYRGANDWAGRVCAEHAVTMPWSERLPEARRA